MEGKEHKQAEWTDNIEKIVGDIGNSCGEYKYINMNAARSETVKYDILMYCIIIIGPISGILSSLDTKTNADKTETFRILIIIFSFISGVLSAIIKFSKFEKRATSHKSICSKFASLEGNIQRQLSLNREERQHAGKYLDWISRSFEELFNSSPIILDTVYQKWLQERIESSFKKAQESPKAVSNELPKEAPKEVVVNISEPNTFNDGNMKYELGRLQCN